MLNTVALPNIFVETMRRAIQNLVQDLKSNFIQKECIKLIKSDSNTLIMRFLSQINAEYFIHP